MAKKNAPAKSGTTKASLTKATTKKPAAKSSVKKTTTTSKVKKDNTKPVVKNTSADYKEKVLKEILTMYKVDEATGKKMLDSKIIKEGFDSLKHPKSIASECKKAFEAKSLDSNSSAKKSTSKANTPDKKKPVVKQVGADANSETLEEGAEVKVNSNVNKEDEAVTVTAENVNDIIHGMGNPEVSANAGAVSQAVGHQGGVPPQGNAHPQSEIPQSALPIEAMGQPTPTTNANHQAHLQNSIISHGETILGLIMEDFRMKRWGGMPFNLVQQVVNRSAKEYLYETHNTEKGAYFFVVVGDKKYRFPKNEDEFIPIV